VPQKWRNCEGRIPEKSKSSFFEQQPIAKPIFCDAARRLNYLFSDSENFSHAQWRNISAD
jgi:hypothetical protein